MEERPRTRSGQWTQSFDELWEIWVDDPVSFGCVHQQVAPLSAEVRGFLWSSFQRHG